MVLALAGDSTTTTSMRRRRPFPGWSAAPLSCGLGAAPLICARVRPMQGRPGCRGDARSARRARARAARAAPRRSTHDTGGSVRQPAAARARAARAAGSARSPLRGERPRLRRVAAAGGGGAALRTPPGEAWRRRAGFGATGNGPSAARTSAAVSISVAPSRSSWLVPRWRGSSGEPGTAMTSRPCSAARRAVISEPELRGRLDHHDARARGRRSAGCGAGNGAPGARAERPLGDHGAGLRRSAPSARRCPSG